MNPGEPNLRNHFDEVRSQFPEAGISTIIFCGKIDSKEAGSAGDPTPAMQLHRQMVEEELNRKISEHITGILIGQGNSILHLLEGPSEAILRILCRLLEREKSLEEGPLSSCRIVYSVEDRPVRFFNEWLSSILPERKATIEELTSETSVNFVHDMAMGLFDMGKSLQADDAEEMEFSRYAENLPPKNLVLQLSSSNDFFSLEEYVEMYASPFHVELDSERTWPLERLVNY